MCRGTVCILKMSNTTSCIVLVHGCVQRHVVKGAQQRIIVVAQECVYVCYISLVLLLCTLYDIYT